MLAITRLAGSGTDGEALPEFPSVNVVGEV
jgi:hypothetical protein